MSVEQKVQVLETLLARVQQNRLLPRKPADLGLRQVAASAAHPSLEPELEVVDADDVEIFDDEIVDLTGAPVEEALAQGVLESDVGDGPTSAAAANLEVPLASGAEASSALSAQPAPRTEAEIELRFTPPPQSAQEAQPTSDLEADLRADEAPQVQARTSSSAPPSAEAKPSSPPISGEAIGAHTTPELLEQPPVPDASSLKLASEKQEPAETEDEPPASSQRSRAATSMGEALSQVGNADLEREAPLKTPPPESGPQAASPPVIPPQARVPSPEELPGAPGLSNEPERAARLPGGSGALSIQGRAPTAKPKTFLEILQSTLRLGRAD